MSTAHHGRAPGKGELLQFYGSTAKPCSVYGSRVTGGSRELSIEGHFATALRKPSKPASLRQQLYFQNIPTLQHLMWPMCSVPNSGQEKPALLLLPSW